jgi:hypothetical protein
MITVSFQTTGDPEQDICVLADMIAQGVELDRNDTVAWLRYIIELIKNRDCAVVGHGAP